MSIRDLVYRHFAMTLQDWQAFARAFKMTAGQTAFLLKQADLQGKILD